MPSVDSSAISYAEYDEKSRELVLTFVKTGPYTFYGVPRVVYDEFMDSPSKGRYYNVYIRGQYK